MFDEDLSDMSLRLGVDLDGTLADLSRAYRECERRVFGDTKDQPIADPEDTASGTSDAAKLKVVRRRSLRQEHVWRTIKQTPDFWMGLEPIEPGAIAALYEAALQYHWEVFFITQRPATAGATVQLQSQRWLMQHGFATPSVLTVVGSRGKAAHALELDYLIDDLPKNCVDAVSDSKCRPLLVLRRPDPVVEENARRLDIGVVRSVAEALALPALRPKPAGFIDRLLGRSN